MSYRIPNANTTLTSTTGWDTVTNTPTLHASTDITITGTIYTAAYTAPNTSNYATGVAIMLRYTGYYGSGNLTITCTLQEFNGSTWSDTSATATITSIPTATGGYNTNTWAYFRYGTPYQFTTTSSGYYRVKITRGSSTSSPTARADSGGSNCAFMATDDRTGAIGSTDDLLVLGHNFSTTPITVTWDGTVTIGSGQGALADITTSVTLQTALYIGSYGTVTADTTADVTTTCTGHVIMAVGSTWNIGSSSTPYPSSYKFTFQFNPTTTCDFCFRNYNGTINFYGQPKSSTTLWKTTYSSGAGTAASPLILTDAVDWSVGDEICILASSNNTTNYNENEYRFIITKNSSTSYVLSNTRGGSENALTYTHNTNAYVLNIERNIIFTTTSTTKGWFLLFTNVAVSGNVQSNGYPTTTWVRWEQLGRTAGGAPYYGAQFCNGATATCTPDYSVFNNTLYYSWYVSGSVTKQTYNGLIFVRNNTSANYYLYMQNAAQKTIQDFFFVDNYPSGGIFTYGSTNTYIRCILNGIRRTAGSIGGIALAITTNSRFIDCEVNCSASGVYLSSTTDTCTFENCSFGTKGYNDGFSMSGDIATNTSPGYSNIQFIDCNFGSPDTLSPLSGYSYQTLLKGSEIRIHNKNISDNANFWYTPFGVAQATGYGLSDTLVRTPGSLNVRIAPESTDPGFTWSFLIPATKNTTVSFSGYFLKNVAMGTDVCTVSLYLPGNPIDDEAPDASATLNDNTSATWTGNAVQSINIAAYYSGNVDGFATVGINAKSTTSGAYLYCADFFNSGDTTTLFDKLAGLAIWYNGKPAPIITQLNLGGIAPAVWAVATSGLTSTGTIGKLMVDMATNNDIKG